MILVWAKDNNANYSEVHKFIENIISEGIREKGTCNMIYIQTNKEITYRRINHVEGRTVEDWAVKIIEKITADYLL